MNILLCFNLFLKNLLNQNIDKLVGTGPHFTLKDISRHTHSEYECVARNTIEPDSSRHFKLNVNCWCYFFIFNYFKIIKI